MIKPSPGPDGGSDMRKGEIKKKNLLYFQTCLRCHDRQILLITVKLIKQHKKKITLIHVHAIYACYFVFCRKCRIKTIRIMCSY